MLFSKHTAILVGGVSHGCGTPRNETELRASSQPDEMNGVQSDMDVARDNAPSSSMLSLTDVRGNLREVVDEIVRTGGEVTITRHGKPVAVLLAHDEYESLVETVNILSDDETMAAIAQSEAEFAAGKFSRIDQI